MSAGELGYKGMERVSCRAAVCSEQASCFLLILVSQCPLSSQNRPKRRTDTALQRQSLLVRGVPFRDDGRAPGYLWRPYALIRAELLLLHQSFTAGQSPPSVNPVSGLAWPDQARPACGRPQSPQGGVDELSVPIWI